MAVKPHSGEWFRQLSSQSPEKAARVRRYVEDSGTLECCSFCGSVPSGEYEDEGRPGRTARLCDECLVLYRNDYAERWVPMET